MIDLHIHSIYSDGTDTIEQIIDKAKSLNLSQIAITDHNTLEGSIIAHNNSSINSIIGTELSVGYKGAEVHLLGYFPKGSDYKNVNFIIKEGEVNKKVAVLEMIENLNAMGFDLDVLELAKYSKGQINRVHICMAMMDHGYIKSIDEGFQKYVGEHCEAYVERKVTPLKEAAEAIHKDGGFAIIAHPYEYEDVGPIELFLQDIINDIDGVECFHPSATKENSDFLVNFANKYNKKITGGSDYHGTNKPNINLNQMNVEDIYRI